MKYIIYLLFLSQITQAQQSRFKEGENLYVWALNGLNMRKLPDAKSDKIAALPYGEKVSVQANIGVIVAHEVEEFKDFKVKGVWLLVKYGDKEGFVFDGYLSRLVAPVKSENGVYSLIEYLKKNIGRKGNIIFTSNYDKKERKVVKEDEFSGDPQRGNYEMNFNYGISYYLHIGEGSEETFTFPNVSLYEGYIFAKTIFSLFDFRYDKSNKKFILDNGETCQFEIFMKEKNLIINGGCNC